MKGVLLFFLLFFSSCLAQIGAWNDYRGVGEEWGSPRWSFRSGLSGRMSPIGRYPSEIRPRPAPIGSLPSGGIRPRPIGPIESAVGPGRITPRLSGRGFSSRKPYPIDNDYYRPRPADIDYLRPPGIRPTPFGPLSGRSAMYDLDDSDSDESDSDESGEDDDDGLQGRFFGGFIKSWACNVNNFKRAVWGLKPNCGSSISPPRSPPPPPPRPRPPPPPPPIIIYKPPPPPPPPPMITGLPPPGIIQPPMGPTTLGGRSMYWPPLNRRGRNRVSNQIQSRSMRVHPFTGGGRGGIQLRPLTGGRREIQSRVGGRSMSLRPLIGGGRGGIQLHPLTGGRREIQSRVGGRSMSLRPLTGGGSGGIQLRPLTGGRREIQSRVGGRSMSLRPLIGGRREIQSRVGGRSLQIRPGRGGRRPPISFRGHKDPNLIDSDEVESSDEGGGGIQSRVGGRSMRIHPSTGGGGIQSRVGDRTMRVHPFTGGGGIQSRVGGRSMQIRPGRGRRRPPISLRGHKDPNLIDSDEVESSDELDDTLGGRSRIRPLGRVEGGLMRVHPVGTSSTGKGNIKLLGRSGMGRKNKFLRPGKITLRGRASKKKQLGWRKPPIRLRSHGRKRSPIEEDEGVFDDDEMTIEPVKDGPANPKCKEKCKDEADDEEGKICGLTVTKTEQGGLKGGWYWYKNQCERRCDLAIRHGTNRCQEPSKEV